MNDPPNRDAMSQRDADVLIEFSSIKWQTSAKGVRVKEVVRGDRRIRMVEFSEEFEEPAWCRRGHIGIVVEGTLEIVFADRVVAFRTGDALTIPPGVSFRHKARMLTGKAILFLVEPIE